MTKIEEAAQKYVDQRTWDDVCEKNDALAAFMDGAEWQRGQAINDACEWLKNKIQPYLERIIMTDIIDNFRKSLEDKK